MKKNLLAQALTKFFSGVLLFGLLVFLPAGSFRFWNGWLLMGILFGPMFVAGIILLSTNPQLLRKRLNAKEEQKEQQTVVALSGAMFVASFVLAGLNWRYHWLVLPHWVVWAAAGIFLMAWLLYAEVLKENAFLSRTIEVQEGQTVIDTGLYGIVRHPMYTATLLLFLMMPLVLGSLFSFLVTLLYLPILSKRIRNEEAVLEEELAGYKEYKEKVKYKLIPFVW